MNWKTNPERGARVNQRIQYQDSGSNGDLEPISSGGNIQRVVVSGAFFAAVQVAGGAQPHPWTGYSVD